MSLKSRQKCSGNPAMAKIMLASAFILFVIAISTAHAGGSCDVVKDGLVACYPFDGNANDASGNGNHGNPQSDISFVEGKVGKAAKFNGNADSYIRIPNPAQKFNEQFSVAGWVLTNGDGGSLFTKYTWATAGSGGKGFVVNASDDLSLPSSGSAIAALDRKSVV